jgi:hypothetical protein
VHAFEELSTCRPPGMTVGRIPWTAIHEYATAQGIADPERFHHLIRAMDRAALEHFHREATKRA